MQKNPTWLAVAAAAMKDRQGHLLMHRRPPGKRHAGLWEFPGGKVEWHETPQDALHRELREELGIELHPRSVVPAAFAQSQLGEDDPPIVILLYTVAGWDGTPQALEGGECRWFTRAEAARLAMPPLDLRLLGLLPE